MIILFLYMPILIYLIVFALKRPRAGLQERRGKTPARDPGKAKKADAEKRTRNERKIELLRMQSKQLKIQRARVLEKYRTLESEYPDAGAKRQLAIIKEFEKLDDAIYQIDFKRAKLYNEYLNLSGTA